MSIEAMKMALAKFEHLWEIGIDAVYKVELLPEIQALRQAIEQAEKQEPVRWFQQFGDAPPRKEWVGLTEEEKNEIFDHCDDGYSSCGVCGACSKCQREVSVIHATEAKLKEKNGG